MFLIRGIIIAATVGDDRSVANCMCGILPIGVMHRMTAQVRARFPGRSPALDGKFMILFNQGQKHIDVLHSMRVDDQGVMAAARSKGLRKLGDIRYALLERSGTVSLPNEDPKHASGAEKSDGNEHKSARLE